MYGISDIITVARANEQAKENTFLAKYHAVLLKYNKDHLLCNIHCEVFYKTIFLVKF